MENYFETKRKAAQVKKEQCQAMLKERKRNFKEAREARRNPSAFAIQKPWPG